MTTTKKTAEPKTTPELPDIFYRITALLHTMRCIAQHEDRLCLLRNEIKRSGTVGPRLSKELQALLDELPSDDYRADLEAVHTALSSPPPSPKPAQSRAKQAFVRHLLSKGPKPPAEEPA